MCRPSAMPSHHLRWAGPPTCLRSLLPSCALRQQARDHGGTPIQRLAVGTVKASRSAATMSSVPTTVPVSAPTTGTMASDSVLAKALS
jgi:hypothetical protein